MSKNTLSFLFSIFNSIEETGLCDEKGIYPGSVTKQICLNEENVCETYIKKGVVNDVDINSCTDYCNAHGLSCKEQHDDDDNGCKKGEKYKSCDETGNIAGGETNDHICVCGMLTIY